MRDGKRVFGAKGAKKKKREEGVGGLLPGAMQADVEVPVPSGKAWNHAAKENAAPFR